MRSHGRPDNAEPNENAPANDAQPIYPVTALDTEGRNAPALGDHPADGRVLRKNGDRP
jgi:hypothetical protein